MLSSQVVLSYNENVNTDNSKLTFFNRFQKCIFINSKNTVTVLTCIDRHRGKLQGLISLDYFMFITLHLFFISLYLLSTIRLKTSQP